MGINSRDLRLLVRLARQGYIKHHGRIVEIGAQQLSNDFLRAEALVRDFEAAFAGGRAFSLPKPSPTAIGLDGNEIQSSTAPFARDFWAALGFDYTAIDVDGSPGSIPLDLNFDRVPETMRGKFDLVTNLGTSEHVCNQLNAFKAIHDLAAPGGVIIHHLPAGGALDHALFNYNPKFFWHLARSNDYRWLYADFYGGPDQHDIPNDIRDFVREYDPESSSSLSRQKVANYGIQIAFRKTLDIPFVPPIDVATGTTVSDPQLNRRYWTVFQPHLLEAMKSGNIPPEFRDLLTPKD